MVNKELARIFDQTADLMEIQGGDRFRINSYRRAGRTLGDLSEDVAALADENRLTDVPGVGKGTAERIKQFLTTGKIDVHEDLLAKVPAELPRLLDIPGLGPKKIALAWKELGVTSIEELKAAIDSGRLEALPGFGKQSVKKVSEGIYFLERSGGRTPMGQALAIAESFVDALADLKSVKRVEIAGSLRRGSETIGDVDLLCETSHGAQVIKAFTRLEPVKTVLAAGTTKGSVLVPLPGRQGDLQVDLRAVENASFGAALQYFTGSKEHNVRLRERAVKKGWKLNEYGLFDGDKTLAGKTEEGIYKKLGLPWIPPELREDRGELDTLPKNLIELKDIRGDLHVHTVASDGRCTIEQMAEAARDMGYEYIAITDHSKSSVIANGLSAERAERHIADVHKADKKIKGIRVYAGCECDILAKGELDYSDDLLAKFDIVIVSVHAGLGQDRQTVTGRTIRAIENPYVDVVGHPTGRLIGKREPMDLDMAKVIDASRANDTALEINASWQRLDLKDQHARQVIDAGVQLMINTDAHHVDQLAQMRLGVMTGRRAWVPTDAVVNTRTLAAFDEWLAR